MMYKKDMLCKHFKGATLLDKNIYRIISIGVKGTDIDTSKITYSGDGDMLVATNLVVYENIFQGRLFAREYEDISSTLSIEKQQLFNQIYKVQPLSREEISLIQSESYKSQKKLMEEQKQMNK